MNVYQIVTDRIIEELKKEYIPWQKPWMSMRLQSGAYNRITKRPYSILNQLLLQHEGEYATIRQWNQLGGKIKKGSKAEIVVFWKLQEFQEEKENGEVEEKKVPLLRYYRVFHISAVDGVTPLSRPEPEEVLGIEAGDKVIREYADREHVLIREEYTDEAYYSPSRDQIVIPGKQQYKDIHEFYSTAFHEMVHSTGHKTRLDRDMSQNIFGSEGYSKEELIAEIGSAMLMCTVGIDTKQSFRNSAAYIQGWLRQIQQDERLVVSAAGKAEKAVKYILNISSEEYD
jgi:antirestriction protein ArdC